MKILFVHQNFPGQYRALAPSMKKLGHDVMAISCRKDESIFGIKNNAYAAEAREIKSHPWLANTESALYRAEKVAKLAYDLKAQGYQPDAIVGHAGWGEMWFMRQVFPHAKLMGYQEYFYKGTGSDVNFDPEFLTPGNSDLRCHVRNLHLVSSLVDCDISISPTKFQAGLFPDMLREKITVVHDGIETHRLLPDPSAWIELGREKKRFKYGDQIVTFINRNLEPMRGYHAFMRSLPGIMKRLPNARIVIVGGDQVSYGAAPKDGKSYKQTYLNEVKDKIDMNRIHFVGQVPYSTLVNLLRVSAAHVYLTAPFVLSWSTLEAMSLGCCVIGSKTPPVEEVIEHGKNGLLVDFFNPDEIAEAVVRAIEHPNDMKVLRQKAREFVVENYDYNSISFPKLRKLIED
jgi:glycosyltransferase involved in cell wall biosynthesis